MKKVLLVEDDEFLLGMYETKLKVDGFDVAVASDGEEALEKLDRDNFDIVLLDIMMPKLNGFEVLKEIRSVKKLTIPVIILTNLGQKSDTEQGLTLGANDYVVKANFTPQEVIEKINKLIS